MKKSKRIMSLALALIMVLAFSACGGVAGKTVSLGTVTDNVYKNEYLGIGYEPGSEWVFRSKTEILETNNLDTELTGEELDKALSELEDFTDMFATGPDGFNNVQVSMANIGLMNSMTSNVSDYLDANESSMIEGLEDMGAENVEVERQTLSFVGEDSDAISFSYTYMGVDIHQTIVCVKRGSYLVAVTATCFFEDDRDNMFSKFYALD